MVFALKHSRPFGRARFSPSMQQTASRLGLRKWRIGRCVGHAVINGLKIRLCDLSDRLLSDAGPSSLASSDHTTLPAESIFAWTNPSLLNSDFVARSNECFPHSGDIVLRLEM